MDHIYCLQTANANISYQLRADQTGSFLVGHSYLYYVNLIKGYQVINLNPPVNVTPYTFISYAQGPTTGIIGQIRATTVSDCSLPFSNVDMYWDDVNSKWSPFAVPTTGNSCRFLQSQIRMLTAPFVQTISETVNLNYQYLYPGQFNITALAQETGQNISIPVKVRLGRHVLNLRSEKKLDC
jgi:hypothetical protein